MRKVSKKRTACITGHHDVPENRVGYIKNELRREIGEAVADGYEHFISGFSEGVDQLAAEVVLDLQKDWPGMTLGAAIPYRDRLKKLEENRETAVLLHGCSNADVYSDEYAEDSRAARGRGMVDQCGRVIAIYDGRGEGGTVRIIRYAESKRRELRIVGY